MRTISSGINTELTAQGATPGWLVQLDLKDPVTGAIASTLRRCSFDVSFPYGGYTWDAEELVVEGLSWDATSDSPRLTIGDQSLAYYAFAANGAMRDAPVSLWQVYLGVPNEAVSLWTGRVGTIRRGMAALEITLVKDATLKTSPRRRVQNLIPAKFLLPPGKLMTAGGSWNLERK